MIVLLSLLGCPAGTPTDTDKTTTDTMDSAPECAVLNSGTTWYWNGECPQMVTPCDIVVDGCTLTIDYEADGGMTMGMPYDGVIEGDTITFGQGEDWGPSGCVGTIVSPDEVTGTCDGCDFTLQRE